jgi:hypothetical protein
MIWWINFVSNMIVLAICLWAVLNPRVETKIVGTVSLSSLGIFSALTVLKPGMLGFWETEAQTMANVSLAALFLWGFLRYRRFIELQPSSQVDQVPQ